MCHIAQRDAQVFVAGDDGDGAGGRVPTEFEIETTTLYHRSPNWCSHGRGFFAGVHAVVSRRAPGRE